MTDLSSIDGLREGQIRIPSGCAISGIFSKTGAPISGDKIIRSIATMHERSNGLGGGFAGYGIYPQYKELYAFHVFYDTVQAKEACEQFLDTHFDIADLSKIHIRRTPKIVDEPLIWRYFLRPLPTKREASQLDEREYVVRSVFAINTKIKGAYVFSCGKNMGVFKAVGFPEDVGEFYRLEEYGAYCWTDIPQIPPAGGAAPIPLRCWTIPSYITAKFPPMTPIGVLLKCSDINARCRQIRKSLRT